MGWTFTCHIWQGRTTAKTGYGVRVCVRDARHRLQEGHTANGVVDAVTWRDEFSLASRPQYTDTASASSLTTIVVMLVRYPKMAANDATAKTLTNTQESRLHHATSTSPKKCCTMNHCTSRQSSADHNATEATAAGLESSNEFRRAEQADPAWPPSRLEAPRWSRRGEATSARIQAESYKLNAAGRCRADQQSPKAEKGLYFAGLTGTGRGIFGSGMDAKFIADDISKQLQPVPPPPSPQGRSRCPIFWAFT
nr:unnamed protein product [Digitaria exilis]